MEEKDPQRILNGGKNVSFVYTQQIYSQGYFRVVLFFKTHVLWLN
jgi:hypothetical protein